MSNETIDGLECADAMSRRRFLSTSGGWCSPWTATAQLLAACGGSAPHRPGSSAASAASVGGRREELALIAAADRLGRAQADRLRQPLHPELAQTILSQPPFETEEFAAGVVRAAAEWVVCQYT